MTQDKKVQTVYSKIANEFDVTRKALWPGVVSFINAIDRHAIVLDIGCGNGKYHPLLSQSGHIVIGLDICPELASIAKNKTKSADVLVCKATRLPFATSSLDGVICIAMMHHLSSREEHLKLLNEIVRVLRPEGKAHVTVWAADVHIPKKDTWIKIHEGSNDYLVPWKSQKDGRSYLRFYHLFSALEMVSLLQYIKGISRFDMHLEQNNWHVSFHKAK